MKGDFLMRAIPFAVSLGLMAGLAGPASARAEPLEVVATIGMIGDVVEQVGGDCVAVTTIMGPGVDPHLYQARPADVRSLQTADAIFYSGLSLEGRLGEVLDRFGRQKPTVALSAESVPREDLIATDDAYGVDPHLWMDVGLWSGIVPAITETLTGLRPDCADGFAANAEAYRGQLLALDGWVREAIASIPEERRTLVTAHDAFAYYERAYGIEVAGIQGISTESEASIADIRATADLIADKGVPAVFVESTVNPRTMQAVIDAVRQRGAVVEVAGELYSDAMGEAGTAAGTYLGMIHANTRAITWALGGTVPDLPPALTDWAAEWNLAAAEG